MKICFPLRDKRGNGFPTLDEMTELISREPHGCWLAGINRMWHGGIHITDKSAPDAVMNSETAETVVPLQFMVGGEVVAWRINRDYLTSEYMDNVPQFSSTFVLVKSVCTPEAEKPDNSLEFYTLYMGLAPLSVFPRYKQYQVAEKVTRLVRRRYTGQEKEGDTIPADTGKRLKAGDRVMVVRESRFAPLSNKISNRNALEAGKEPEVPPQIFGLARLLNDKNEMTGDAFWVTVAPEYMTLVGEAPAGLPAWMREAVSHDVYDQVVMPAKKISVQAGEAVGFLAEDAAPDGQTGLDRSWFVHIEAFSTDERMKDFLNNTAQVQSGEKYIHIHPEAEMYIQTDNGFIKNGGKVKVDIHRVLPQEKCQPFTDSEGKRWFDIGQGRGNWLSEEDVDADISQYDLAKRGFCAFEEEATSGMEKSLQEGWAKQAMAYFAEAVMPARGIREKLVSNYYRTLVDRMDTDHNGRLSADEVCRALNHPELEMRDVAARLVIKHDSEWYGDSCHKKWAGFLRYHDALQMKYANKWLDSMEWMSHVPPFDKGEPIWHMHPVMFLDAIKQIDKHKECYCYKQGIIDRPCQSGARDVTKNDFELLASQLGIEREVLRAIAVAETGDKVPFKQYVNGEDHATILYERHYMKRLALKLGTDQEKIKEIESSEPEIIHSWERNYRYGSESIQYKRLIRAREINYDAANMSCSWGKFQVMGEYYFHLYESTKELVDAQNYCALQHLQYFKVFLIKEKRMLQSMKDKDWLTIAKKYNGEKQEGYDEKIKNAYNSLKGKW